MDEKSIFLTALDLEGPEARSRYLDGVCGDNHEMRGRIETLLRTYEDAGSFLEHPPEGVDPGRTEVAAGDTAEPGSDPGDQTLPQNVSDEVNLDFLAPSESSHALGRIGHYEVQSVIGRGGMGIVLRAHDPKLGRIVAVKVLAPEYAANPTARARFNREARAAAAVSHPHVIMTHQVEEDGQPPYLVMEYVDGQSLRQKIERRGALETREILRIGAQVAAGLAAAHKQGLMHRDIKPANILLENGIERVKITDFGLARTVDDIGVTRTGEVAGTPQFMSPEQARGDAIDQRSDLFSLGSVLYAMCTGHAPFRADTTYGVIRRVIEESPRPIREINPDIPVWLSDVIEKLLAKDPQDRFQTAAEVSDLLEQYLAYLQHPGSAPEPAPIGKTIPSGTASGRIPQPVNHRPNASAQSHFLGWLTLVLAAVTLVPCLILTLTEVTGVTNLVATMLPEDGTLVVEVDEPTAIIVVSGRYAATALSNSRPHELRPGEYSLTVTSTANGQYQTNTQTVTIESGKQTVVTVHLNTAQPAELEPVEVVDAPSLADNPHQSFRGWGASWSPDGTAIVLQSSSEIGADPQGMLQILNLESGLTRPLVRRGKDPAWSPQADGPIAYVLHGQQREDIWLIDPDGRNNRELVEGGYPAWSADGSTLYYHHNPSGTLRSINVDDPSATPQTLMDCPYLYPSVSPDGRNVVLREGPDLCVYDIATGDLLVRQSLEGTQGLLAGWTPDSRSIIFGGFGFRPDRPLTLMDVGTGQTTPLLQESLTLPRVSPDGSRLVADDRIEKSVVVLSLADLLHAPPDDGALIEERLKVLISEAASIPSDEWISLAGDVKGPGASAVTGTPLSLVLLTLDPLAIAQEEPGVRQDFWYLTERMPRPSEIARAMSPSMPRGYVSAIQPEYVTNSEINVDGGVARGFVGFSAPKLYVGRVQFVAELTDGAWTIRELALPNYGVTLRRREDGVWEKFNRDSSVLGGGLEEPVSQSGFFSRMSDLPQFLDTSEVPSTVSITQGLPDNESDATPNRFHYQAQLVSDVVGPPEDMSELMSSLEAGLRGCARQTDTLLDSIETGKDTEGRIVRVVVDYTANATSHGEVELRLAGAEAPEDIKDGRHYFTLTIRIEEWVRIPAVGADGLLRTVTSGEETGIPPAPPQAVRD